MDNFNKVQKGKLNVVLKAVSTLIDADVSGDMKHVIGKLYLASKEFKESLPFAISEEQLSRHWLAGDEVDDWKPQSLFEKELFNFLRSLESMNSSFSISQIYLTADAIFLLLDGILPQDPNA